MPSHIIINIVKQKKNLTLGQRIAICWPAERMPIHSKQCVLLLHAEPDTAVGNFIHYILAGGTMVVF